MTGVVRRATPEDKPRLLILAEQFLRSAPHITSQPTNTDHLGHVIDKCFAEGAVFVVDEPETGVVGMFGMVFGNHPLTLEVTAFEVVWYMLDGFRGGSAALRLFKSAEEEARQAGATVLQVGSPNDKLDRVLERFGFTRREATYYKTL